MPSQDKGLFVKLDFSQVAVKHSMDTDLYCMCGIIMTGFSGCVFYVCICDLCE